MTNAILQTALHFRDIGWSVIPMKTNEKKPATKWKRYQKRTPSESTVRRWFADDGMNLAVIFGAVSDNLASRDFDELPAFQEWEQEHPDLAATLPIVETRRGRHVYFQTTPQSVSEARKILHKPGNGTGAIHLPQGELRAGVGCYSVLPPSIHPSGFQYRWIREPELPMPVIDPAIFLSVKCYREDGEYREDGGEQRLLKTVSNDGREKQKNSTEIPDMITYAIEQTALIKPGTTHESIFLFARHLKAIPEIAHAELPELKPILQQWFEQAKPGTTKRTFTEVWFDFTESWGKVKYPIGEEPIAMSAEQAAKSELPEVAKNYDSPEVQALIAVCRELQRAAGEGPFFLDCRTAGKLLGVEHNTANRYLRGLCRDKVLKLIEKGSQQKRRANRYRYLHPI